MKNRYPYVLLDRDGTIIEHVHHLTSLEEVRILDGAVEALNLLQSSGFRLAVITNQSVIGLGLATSGQVDAINEEIRTRFSEQSIKLEFFLVCPHTQIDACNCRKPKPGLSIAASEKGVNLKESFMIGDSVSDMSFGKNSGVRASVHISKPKCEAFEGCVPVENIWEAANYIKGLGKND